MVPVKISLSVFTDNFSSAVTSFNSGAKIFAKKVIVYYIDIIDYKEIEQFIKDNNATEIEVELKDLKNLLHDIVVEDIVEFATTEKAGVYTTEITKFSFFIHKLIGCIHKLNCCKCLLHWD